MSASRKPAFLDLPILALWLATFLGAIVATHLLRGAHFPIGWNYLVLFLLAGVASSFGKGIYRWFVAVWGGALVMLLIGTLRSSGYLATPPGLLAAQYLPAALSGALLGEWLRYTLSRWQGRQFSQYPSMHLLLMMAALLILLPLLAFLYAAEQTLARENLVALLMFAPGNTPFLFPSLLTAALCGYWVSSAVTGVSRGDKLVARLVMACALLLMLLAAGAKFIFGVIEVA